jgi:glycosyltransferase involved in cell wall biosynthesis
MLHAAVPKITVIVGVLNMKNTLPGALESVINQHYPNLELIVMDGGSTDGTQEIIKHYEQHLTYWRSEIDHGHADACNKAIDIATGELIHFLNADDTMQAPLLQEVADIYRNQADAKIISCGVRILKKNMNTDTYRVIKEIIKPEELQISLHNMLYGLPIINARFFHRSIFKQFGKFTSAQNKQDQTLSNDREFMIKLALAGVQSQLITKPLYCYLSHHHSYSFNPKNRVRIHNEHLKLAEKLFSEKNISAPQQKMVRAWQSQEAAYLFLFYFLQGNFKNMFQMIKKGFLQYGGLFWLGRLGLIATRGVIKKAKSSLRI